MTIFQDGVLGAEQSYGLPSYATMFQVELVAISKALELCGHFIRVFSLKRSSLMALSNPGC